MDDHRLRGIGSGAGAPIIEANLHAYVDRQLGPERLADVEAFLAARPDERARVQDWIAQNDLLRGLLDPVLDEPLPSRLATRLNPSGFAWRPLAAGVLIAVVSGGAAWTLRGRHDADAALLASVNAPANPTARVPAGGWRAPVATDGELTGFARRAAVAHAVYTPEVRRPVEVGADQEQALVTWLTKRMGTAVRAPSLAALGYELIGGRLLPGEKEPVAQFMYDAGGGRRLTLYVTREVPGQDTAFRFGQDGAVNVFYWVEGRFGYAISAGADRDTLMKVSQEVYRQLRPG